MPIAADFSVSRSTGNIRHVSGTATYSVLEFHRYLQDLADDAAAVGNDELDITDVNPSERATDNIITLLNGYNIDDTAAQYLYNGSITQADGATVYSGLVVVGSVEPGTQLQVVQNNAVYTSFWGTGINADPTQNIISRMLIKTRTGGNDIDGKRLRVVARELSDTYAEFSLTCGEGNNTAALFTVDDLNNQTAAGTIAGWTITNTEGYQGLDVDNNGTNEFYYSKWDNGTQSRNDLYEYTKWLTRRGTSSSLYGTGGFLFRGITHEIAYGSKAGSPFQQNESLSWGSGATAGTGRVLALSNPSGAGNVWIQLLTGVAPAASATITGGTSGGTATVSGTPTQRTVNSTFLGNSTGSAILGAYGVGIKVSALTASDKLTALDGVTRSAPNTVTFTVAGLVSGEDRVYVAPWDGVTYDSLSNPVPNVNQFSLNTALTGAAVSSVIVGSSIPSDTPASGTIRVVNNSGYEVRLPYSSWSGSTFTLSGTYNFAGTNENAPANVGNGVYITYIDKLAGSSTESFSVIYSADRNLVVRVRDGGASPIKTFTAPSVLGSGGGSVTAIRTTDA